MSFPNDKTKGARPAVTGTESVAPEYGAAGRGPATFDGRNNERGGAEPEGPFIAYWKTPAKVLRHFGGND